MRVNPGEVVGERATAPDIVRFVYFNRAHLRACVTPEAPARAGRSDERIEIDLRVEPSGSVSGAHVDVPSGSPIEPICVAAVLSQFRFPPPGRGLVLRFPVDCSPRAVDPRPRARAARSAPHLRARGR